MAIIRRVMTTDTAEQNRQDSSRARLSSIPPPLLRERVAVIVNGNAKGVTKEVISTLDQILLGGDLFVSHQLSDVRDIARTVIDRGYGTVLTGGGDGTFTRVVTEVVAVAARRGRPVPRIGLLKLGTGNALAWVVGARQPKGRGLAADMERLARDAGSRSIRLVEAEGVISPFCGLGADAVVLEDMMAVKGFLERTPLRRLLPGSLHFVLGTLTRTLPGFLVRRVPHCRIVNLGRDAFHVGPLGILGNPIGKDQTLYEGPARVLSMSTIPFSGFGFRYYPYADEREDRMHLRVSTIGVREFVANFQQIWSGHYENPEVLFDFLVEDIEIEMDPPAPFQIGGDLQGERRRVRCRLTPEPIRLVDFYAPPSAS